jgi:Family of unknown function (DUF6011)
MNCPICNRPLKSAASIKRGMGYKCFKKQEEKKEQEERWFNQFEKAANRDLGIEPKLTAEDVIDFLGEENVSVEGKNITFK